MAGLAAAYFVAGRFGLTFHPVAGFATPVWPAAGIALAALLIFGARLWPGVLVGSILANFMSGAPLAAALAIGVGNTFEALVGADLVRSRPGFLRSLETVGTVVVLIVAAAIFSSMISATIGVASLYVGQIIPAARLRAAWQSWLIGDMVGVLLVAPIILVWSAPPRARFRQRWSETVFLTVAIVAVSLVTFFGDSPWIPALATPFHQTALLLAVLIWAALRFGQRGAVTAAFYLSAIAVVATASGHGPFVLPNPRTSIMSLQTSLAIVAATWLLLGATLAERRWALERARQAQDDAERANRAKSEFLTVMSHELRTPLNAIAGFSGLLREGVYGALTPEQGEALARIEHNEKDLLSQIDAVLTFVKLERGEIAVRTEHVPVADAFDAVEPTIAPEIRNKRVVLQRELPSMPVAVEADPKGLVQILSSLVSNASKFTEEGGVITLGAERVDGRVRIWVRDTGIGIAHEEIERVFEPFFQAERGTTRRFSGVGLGLTIARDLARGMHGEVTIASQVGEGTTASVVLPAA